MHDLFTDNSFCIWLMEASEMCFICLLVLLRGESLNRKWPHLPESFSSCMCFTAGNNALFFPCFDCCSCILTALRWHKKKTLSAFNDQRNVEMSHVEELDDLVIMRQQWNESRVKPATELPYNTNELVKGFIYIHRRILGTSFNICYLKDKPKTHI